MISYLCPEKRRHVPKNPKQVTLNHFADRLWKTLPVTIKTQENYRGAYRRYIAPNLGNQPIAEVTKSQIISEIHDLLPQSHYQTVMMLRVIFREAIEHELIDISPASTIKPKKIKVKPQKFLTWEEVSNTHFGKYDSHIKFLALHGLRWGEAAVLTENDISDNKVHIKRSIHGQTKTESGVRTVPYFGYFKVFPKTRVPIANALKPYGVTIHSLRKSYAYFLKSNNVHVTTAAKFMGHSNPLVTLKIYTLVLDDEIDSVGQELRRSLGRT